MFASFGGRLTRGYVVLALVLIVLVAAISTALAFLLYAGTLNEAVSNAAERASPQAQAAFAKHESLAQAAPQLAHDVGRGRLNVDIFDENRKRLAGSPAQHDDGNPFGTGLARLLGLNRAVVHVPGGTIVISPDMERFDALLLRYWAIVSLVGAIAVVVAWLLGRRITRRAIEPLQEVSAALTRIAQGELTPQLLAGGGELAELTKAFNDVAYRLTAETAQREYTQAQMRQLVADAGHELRTPLTVVMGYIDALKNGVVSDPAGVASVYATVLDESRRMRAVIERLIFLARMERAMPPTQAPIDLAELVRDVENELAPLAAGRLRVNAVGAAVVLGDAAELREAIKNAIDNALKYAPGSNVRLDVNVEGPSAVVTVCDDGPGMSEHDRAHAFDRFYRGEERAASEGSGLGLAIAKAVVERNGGTVALESALGRGTTVTIAVPLASSGV
jgi:two-component system OmpR family sensor kinase